MKGWISECTMSHTKCRQGKTSLLPQRLINVTYTENIDQVRLVSTRGMPTDIQNAVLSYRWGIDPTFTLEAHSEEECRSGISIERFPKTIQSAIYFTRKIGLKWLWVDSLCIIQDSVEDSSREIAAMYDIYQNSFISIAALGAASSNDGLYAQRDPLLYTLCFLFRAKDGSPVFVGYVRPKRNTIPQLTLGPFTHVVGWCKNDYCPPGRLVLVRI